MVASLTLKDHHNRCTMQARETEHTFQSCTKTFRVVPESVRAVQVVCVQEVTPYTSELWWDHMQVSRRDDLRVLLNRQSRLILRLLPTAPSGAIVSETGLTPETVILDSGQQQFAAR